jgi:hypothetical protein
VIPFIGVAVEQVVHIFVTVVAATEALAVVAEEHVIMFLDIQHLVMVAVAAKV